MVTMDNAEEYVELMFDFCMHTGIQKQMEAFRGMPIDTTRRLDLFSISYHKYVCFPTVHFGCNEMNGSFLRGL